MNESHLTESRERSKEKFWGWRVKKAQVVDYFFFKFLDV